MTGGPRVDSEDAESHWELVAENLTSAKVTNFGHQLPKDLKRADRK